MGQQTKCTRDEVLAAIRKSAGIKKTIADRLGVSRWTVDNYLARWVTAQRAYDEECAIGVDLAESILLQNLRLQFEEQQTGKKPVDTSDAKWMLAMKGGDRGYAPKQRHEVTGKDEGPIQTEDVTLTDDQRDRAVSSLARAIATRLHSGGAGGEDVVDTGE